MTSNSYLLGILTPQTKYFVYPAQECTVRSCIPVATGIETMNPEPIGGLHWFGCWAPGNIPEVLPYA